MRNEPMRHALYLVDPEAPDPVGELIRDDDGTERINAQRYLAANVVTIHGQSETLAPAIPGADLVIPGTELAGGEAIFARGRLAGAGVVYLTVGLDRGERIAELTGGPAVATLDAYHIPQHIPEGEILMRIAEKIRRILPREAAIRIVVPNDSTPDSDASKRQAEIVAEHAEQEAEARSKSRVVAIRDEAARAAEKARLAIHTGTLYDAASEAARRIGARLVILDDAE